MQVRTFTVERINLLLKNIKNKEDEIKNLQCTTEDDIWLKELDELEKEHEIFSKTMTELLTSAPKKTKKKTK